jgi:hypothetical protein
MTRLCQSILCLAAATAVFAVPAQNLPSLPANAPAAARSTMAPVAQPVSPVAYFRGLLAMSPPERVSFLTNRPPQIRARILIKVQEYESLDPNERELRLRATELRWYLMPLLQMPPTNRLQQLAQVPDGLRGLVKDRLTQWDLLPPPLKQEFLDNDRAIHYFVRIDPPGYSMPNSLSDEQSQKISAQFNRFFGLTPAEKQETLNTLSDAERAQMEKTLQAFDQLPPQQRILCVNNYAKFAGMSAAERAEFLRNADRWSRMSPAERQTWRDLVTHVPEWPPLPAAIFPPGTYPPTVPKDLRPGIATN